VNPNMRAKIMNNNNTINFSQHLFNIFYYIMIASIILGFTYGMTKIAISTFDSLQNTQLTIIAAETNLFKLKEGVSDIFKTNKVTSSYSFESWRPIIISWTPFFIKYIMSLLPMTVFNLPYVGKVVTFIAWATTEASQIPVEPDHIRQAIHNINNLTQNYDSIQQATQSMNEIHTKISQETLEHKNQLNHLTGQLLNMKAKLDIMDLESTNPPGPGGGAGLPARSSDAIFGTSNN